MHIVLMGPLNPWDTLIHSFQRGRKKHIFHVPEGVKDMKEENGKRVGDGQEKWNKKKQLCFWTRKNNYCTSGLHLVNTLWHLDSFGPLVRSTTLSLHGSLQTCPPLECGEKRSKSSPFFSSPKNWSLWFIHFQHRLFSVLRWVCSHAQTGPGFHFVLNQVQPVAGFSALFSTGKQGDNKK